MSMDHLCRRNSLAEVVAWPGGYGEKGCLFGMSSHASNTLLLPFHVESRSQFWPTLRIAEDIPLGAMVS